MTENNRNAVRAEGQAHQGQDPLLELTRLFNLDFNANRNNSVTSIAGRDTNNHPQSGGPDDADLSFLDPSPQNQSTQNAVYQPENNASAPQDINNNPDFLPTNNDQQQPQPQGADLPFNELYDVPSFTPQARSAGAPVETPFGFENEQFDTSPNIPIGDEPDFPAAAVNQNYAGAQSQQLPEDFNFVPEQNVPEQNMQAPQAKNVAASPVSPLNQRGNFTEATSLNSAPSAGSMQYAHSDQSSSPVQETAPIQQYSAFDEMRFDKELENLLVNSPLAGDEEENGPLQDASNILNATAGSRQQPVNQYAVNEAGLAEQSKAFNPAMQSYNQASQANQSTAARGADSANFSYAQNARTSSAPLPYSPPLYHQTGEDNDFLNGNDPLDDDNVYSNGQYMENGSQASHASQSTTTMGAMANIADDPFGLEDLSNEENVIVNPPVYQNDSDKQFQSNGYQTDEDNSGALPVEGQEAEQQSEPGTHFQQEYVQMPPQVQIGQSLPPKHRVEEYAYDTSYDSEHGANGQNMNDPNADLPPDVNTYKFADEIVETTEPVDVPEIPYPAAEMTQKGDALENEYADVFSVGNKQETTNKSAEQDEFFADAYAQSGYNLKQNQSFADNDAAQAQYETTDTYNAYADDGQVVPTENTTVADLQNQQRPKSLARKLIVSSFALLIVVGGGYAATKYFVPSQGNGSSTVIHADNEPFKVPVEQKDTNSDTQNNQDVYSHANGADAAAKDNQDKLVDRSETPEDLTALNNTPEGVDSYTDPSNVEDAIAAASDQSVPTREVQSVVVNPDGTISPSSSQPSQADKMASNTDAQMKPADKANASQETAKKPATNANAQSEANTSTTDSELAKIINDDAQSNEQSKNSAASNTDADQHDFTGLNSVKIPQKKQQAQPIQTADLDSQQPVTLTSTTAMPETTATAKSNSAVPMASVGAGGYYVQIASQPTRESAVASLNSAKSSYGSLIGSLPLSIEPASIPGKGTYYRVRVQVGPRDNAISMCESIKSKNGNCFVGK